MPSRQGRPGAVRKKAKSPKVGSGGQGRKSLEGKGPTPKAEDRSYHPAGKRKAAAERFAARGQRVLGQRVAGQQGQPGRRPKSTDESEIVGGRNSVVEALRARIPATALYIAQRIEGDDRVREAIALAGHRGIALLEVTRPELDRLTGEDSVHQGIALKVPSYSYAHPLELLDSIEDRGQVPLIVAVDGITDPRNLGAILRSVAAFGGQGVVVPQRRSVGVTAAAWKTSAGAAARIPVAMAPNLTQTLTALQERGLFVIGLDAAGDVPLPGLPLATGPLVVVVGSEGKGLSRLVTETCDAVVSVPITSDTESLNAGIAASVTLYEIARRRAETAAE